jgi:hypothetical protein
MKEELICSKIFEINSSENYFCPFETTSKQRKERDCDNYKLRSYVKELLKGQLA